MAYTLLQLVSEAILLCMLLAGLYLNLRPHIRRNLSVSTYYDHRGQPRVDIAICLLELLDRILDHTPEMLMCAACVDIWRGHCRGEDILELIRSETSDPLIDKLVELGYIVF